MQTSRVVMGTRSGDGSRSAAARRVARVLLGLVAMVGAAVLLSACKPPPACTHQWAGPANGDFGSAANWDVGTVPGDRDVACAPDASSIKVTDARTIRRLEMSGSTVHVTAAGTLTLDSTVSHLAVLTIEGTRAGAGSLVVATVASSGSSTFSGGVTTITSALTVAGTLHVRNTASLASQNQTTATNATFRLCDSSKLALGGATTTAASTVTSAGCAAVGDPSFTMVPGTPQHKISVAGALTSTVPLVTSGCAVEISGTLTVPSVQHTTNACGFASPSVLVTGTLTAPTIQLDGVKLAGTGTLKGNVVGVRVASPGTAAGPGTLTITGNYVPSPVSYLDIDLRFHDTPRTDVLKISGSADLGRVTLRAWLIDTVGVAANITFKPLVVGTPVGAFAAVDTPNDAATWTTIYVADGAQLKTTKVVPLLVWPTPGSVLAGAPLSDVELNATAPVLGTFTYSPAAGETLAAGPNQSLSVTFHPADTTTYADATKTVVVNVTASAPTVTWSNPADIAAWTPLGPAQLNATASVPGTFYYTPSSGTVLDIGGARPLSVVFVPTDRSTYPAVRRTVSVNVTEARAGTSFRPEERTAASSPLAMVLGDLNGDGRSDVVTAGYNNVAVRLRTSASAFSPPTTSPLSMFVVNVKIAIGDVDADGLPDIVVGEDPGPSGSGVISVRRGIGAGAFAPPVNTPTTALLTRLDIADLNDDGRLDLLVGTDFRTSVMWGSGTTTFAPPVIVHASGTALVATQLADVNADGRPDLVTATGSPARVLVLLNLGGRAFAPATSFPLRAAPVAVAVGDLTGDGQPDLAVSTSQDTFDLLVGAADGSFGAPVVGPYSAKSKWIDLADMNGDGRQDLVQFYNWNSNNIWVSRTVVQHNQGGLAFVFGDSPSYGDRDVLTLGGAVADVDGDHRPDLVGLWSSISVLRSRAVATVTWPQPAPITPGTPLSAVQLNATASVPGTFRYTPAAGTVLAAGMDRVLTVTFTPTDTATYETVIIQRLIDVVAAGKFGDGVGYQLGFTLRSMATGDLDGDGSLDLVGARAGGAWLSVWLTSGLSPGVDQGFALSLPARAVALAHLDADTELDLVIVNGDDTVSVALGTGTGNFGPRTDLAVGAGATAVAVGDVNGDTSTDLITANTTASTVSVLLGDGTGGFAAKTDVPTGAGPTRVAAADLNGDERADVVTANANDLSTLLGTPAGLGPKVDHVAPLPTSVVLADVNGDTVADLLWTSKASGGAAVNVALGTGTGTFDWALAWSGALSSPVTPAPYDGPVAVAVGDFDRDGHVDLVTANETSGNLSVLFGTGTGSFGSPTTYSTFYGAATGVATGDFDKDGRLDLVFTVGQIVTIEFLRGF